VEAALVGVVTPGNHLIGDGGKAIDAFARRARFRSTPCRRRESRPPRPLTCTSTTSTPTTAASQWLARFNGVATKNLPNYLGWRRALEAWGGQLAAQTWIKGAIGNGPYQQRTL
jgi:hypothetical protein